MAQSTIAAYSLGQYLRAYSIGTPNDERQTDRYFDPTTAAHCILIVCNASVVVAHRKTVSAHRIGTKLTQTHTIRITVDKNIISFG